MSAGAGIVQRSHCCEWLLNLVNLFAYPLSLGVAELLAVKAARITVWNLQNNGISPVVKGQKYQEKQWGGQCISLGRARQKGAIQVATVGCSAMVVALQAAAL